MSGDSSNDSSKKTKSSRQNFEVSTNTWALYLFAESLSANSTAEQKARQLENRVSENLETIDQLRQERSLLASDHKKLQRQFSEVSEVSSMLRIAS